MLSPPKENDRLDPGRFAVILARPENPENIGLAARAMKNTGFSDLRLVKKGRLPNLASKTAVHAEDILASARLGPDLDAAMADCGAVFAATARIRSVIRLLTLAEAVPLMLSLSTTARVGLLFGNERTGLTGDELRRANYVFTIPQAGAQPSYNLGSAVLLTLFALFTAAGTPRPAGDPPLPRGEQDEVIRVILSQLEKKRFIHGTNRDHVADIVHDLVGRMVLTPKDRRFLLALFTKGVDPKES
jgi:TrmH family RNA methyltransferase